ncbi:MAG: hypothetical protein ABSG39_08350 [Acidimicrobiales bacterium]
MDPTSGRGARQPSDAPPQDGDAAHRTPSRPRGRLDHHSGGLLRAMGRHRTAPSIACAVLVVASTPSDWRTVDFEFIAP